MTAQKTICENTKCKKEFTGKRPDARFCSVECKNAFWQQVRTEGLKVVRATQK
jgi:hypothetical protein